jgi:hypothetical protein
MYNEGQEFNVQARMRNYTREAERVHLVRRALQDRAAVGQGRTRRPFVRPVHRVVALAGALLAGLHLTS